MGFVIDCESNNGIDNIIQTRRIFTLFVKYEGSQTTFLHFAVSPSDVTPHALPSISNSTYMKWVAHVKKCVICYAITNGQVKNITLHSGLLNM
jgi:hypothetical protein